MRLMSGPEFVAYGTSVRNVMSRAVPTPASPPIAHLGQFPSDLRKPLLDRHFRKVHT